MAEPNQAPAPDPPPARSCYLIDFERADVVSLMIYPPPPPVLVVTGRKPFANMQVSLNPLRYVQSPDYWGIEVVGCMPPIGQPAIIPYVVELDLTGICGTLGIEVIGASHSEQIQVRASGAGGAGGQTVGRVQDARLHPMHPPAVPKEPVRLTTVSADAEVPPESGEIDLQPFEGSILRVLGTYGPGWIHSAVIAEQTPSDSILAVVAREVFTRAGATTD